MKVMRAKMKVTGVELYEGGHRKVKMSAVGLKDQYPQDGADEDNSYARWTPLAYFEAHIANPELVGKLNPGDVFYVDFTLAGEKSA